MQRILLGANSIALLGLFFCTFVKADEAPSAPPANAQDRESTVIAELKRLILADDWKAADEAARQFLKNGIPKDAKQVNWNQLRLRDAANFPNANPHQKRMRALAARELGLNELAMQLFEQQASAEDSESGRHEAESQAAMCAFRAARAETSAGELDRAADLFGKMESLGNGWVREAGVKKKALVKQLAATPHDVTFRIRFAHEFWVDNVPALGQDYGPARKLLLESLELRPTSTERLQVYERVQQYSAKLKDSVSAEDFATRIEREFGNTPQAVKAAFNRAQHLFATKKFAEAEAVLEKVLAEHPNTAVASRAMLSLSDVCAARNEPEKEFNWLKQCAGLMASAPTNRNILDTDNSRSVAIQRLALRYEAKGDWQNALTWWSNWRPSSWCDTCAKSMDKERETRIAAAKAELQKLKK